MEYDVALLLFPDDVTWDKPPLGIYQGCRQVDTAADGKNPVITDGSCLKKGDSVRVTGYGSTHPDFIRYIGTKRTGTTTIGNLKDNSIHNFGQTRHRQTPAHQESTTVSTGPVDSGSPLLYKNPVSNAYEIIGILSQGQQVEVEGQRKNRDDYFATGGANFKAFFDSVKNHGKAPEVDCPWDRED